MGLSHYLVSLAGAALSAVACGAPVAVTIHSTADSQLSENSPDQNLGSENIMRITSHNSSWFYGNDGRNRVIVGFNLLPHPVGQTLQTATLEIYQTDDPYIYPGVFSVYGVTASWDESTITWNNQPLPYALVGSMPNDTDAYLVASSTQLAEYIEYEYANAASSCSFLLTFSDEYYDGNPNGTRGDTLVSREGLSNWPRLTLIWDGCPVDLTTQGAGPSDPLFGIPDGAITAADLNYYVNNWVAGSPAADLTTQNAPVGDPNYGIPDGLVSAVDIQFYVNLWLDGCP